MGHVPRESRYDVSVVVEKLMWDEKKICANADFYAASAYYQYAVAFPLKHAIFESRF